MNTQETDILVRELIRAYPVWTPDGRQSLLREKLLPYDFAKGLKGINTLIETFKGLPTIADVLDAVRHAKIHEQPVDCSTCDNIGWLLVDPDGQSTWHKCKCTNQNLEPQHSKKGSTTDGHPVATLTEGIAAFRRGLTDERPDLSPERIQESIDQLFPHNSEV